MLSERDVLDLVTRWTTRASTRSEELLVDDFVFSSPIEVHGKADFVQGMINQAPWRRVDILAVFMGPSQAAVFFEGVDPVTNLGHRIGWLLEHRDGYVTALAELNAIVDLAAGSLDRK